MTSCDHRRKLCSTILAACCDVTVYDERTAITEQFGRTKIFLTTEQVFALRTNIRAIDVDACIQCTRSLIEGFTSCCSQLCWLLLFHNDLFCIEVKCSIALLYSCICQLEQLDRRRQQVLAHSAFTIQCAWHRYKRQRKQRAVVVIQTGASQPGLRTLSTLLALLVYC